MRLRIWAVPLVVLALVAALWWFFGPGGSIATRGVAIAGGDGGGLPRAGAADEHFATAALDGLRAAARQRRLELLLIARHGHLVLEYYATPGDTAELRDGGTLTAALLAQAGAERPAEPAALSAALSRQIWQPLNAQDARLVDGRIYARATDWLRLGVLLLGAGQFEGTDVTTAARIADVHFASTAPAGEPPAARDVR